MFEQRKSALARVSLVAAAFISMVFSVFSGRVLCEEKGGARIVTFDVEGAGTTPGAMGCGNGLLTSCYGTTPVANNNAGDIVGVYLTDAGVYYGFLRTRWGKVTSFTAPGADTTPWDFNGTYPYSINARGAVTGMYQGMSEVFHGFVREPNGAFLEIDDPEAGTLAFQGTWPTTINDEGDVAGFYFDASNGVHGFVRSKKGDYTTIDDPNATGGTFVALEQGLNARGTVVGWYFAGGVQFGLLLEPHGEFHTVAPSAASPATFVGGVNASGTATGYFVNPDGTLAGYLRKTDGRAVIFNVAGPEGARGTAAFTLNDSGEITGITVDANGTFGANHGFVRFTNGRAKTFDAKQAGGGDFQGTRPSTINDAGQVIGFVVDGNNVSHGFIREADEDED